MAKYYCQASGEKRGPMGASELKQLARRGVLQPDDLVWEENSSKKVAARSVNGLFATVPIATPQAPVAAPKGPPPVPPMPMASAPMPAAPPPFVPAAVASPVVAAPVIGDDAGPIFKVGKRFSYMQGGSWFGDVYASPGAIYIVKKKKAQKTYGGGLAGSLIAMAAASVPDDTRTCCVGELPGVVRNAVDPKGKLQGKDAIVLPRGAVSFVKMGGVGGVIAVDCGTERFSLTTNFFKGKIRQSFTDAGWPLNEQMTPTAMPLHGKGFNRPEGMPVPKGMSTAKRVLLILLGVGIIVAVIALRVFSDMGRQ